MIIMDKLTLEQAYDGHFSLWDWLAQTGCKDKSEWPGWAEYDRMAYLKCFACEIAKRSEQMCTNCPVEWPGGRGCCCTADGTAELYDQWEYALDINTRKAIAAQIRDLPWRESACT